MSDITNRQENANKNCREILLTLAGCQGRACAKAGGDVGKRGPSRAVGGVMRWLGHHRKALWRLLEKLETEPPRDPAIPPLGTHPEKPKALR